jgi:hypothetical protein
MESVIVYLTWLLDIKFQYKMIRCCFSENENIDKYNISSAFALYGIPLSIIILFYLFGSLILGFLTNLFMPILVIFLVAWGFSAYFAITLNDQFCKKSEKHLNGTQNSLYSLANPHHAIIFAQQKDPFRKMFISDSVDLIISGFDEKIPFKVYPIFCDSDFENVYTNPNIKWLWIIGHGWRGGFVFSQNGKEMEIDYSRYSKNPNLLFIAQLHCNNGSGVSLLEINNLNPDHDLWHMRFPFQNRCYITKKVKEFLSLSL